MSIAATQTGGLHLKETHHLARTNALHPTLDCLASSNALSTLDTFSNQSFGHSHFSPCGFTPAARGQQGLGPKAVY